MWSFPIPTLLKESDGRNNFSSELTSLEKNRLDDRNMKVVQDPSNDVAIRRDRLETLGVDNI